MSIFVRPESPPPRQPSPDIFLAPLPCPHPRRVHSQPRLGLHSPAIPPGLDAPARVMHSSRSFDGLTSRARTPADDEHILIMPRRPRTHSGVKGPVPGSPDPSPSIRKQELNSHVQNTPRASLSSLRSSANHRQPTLPDTRSWPQRIACESAISSKKSIVLRAFDLEEGRQAPSVAFFDRKQSVPPLEKHKSMGMACLKFFGLRGRQTRQQRTAVTAL